MNILTCFIWTMWDVNALTALIQKITQVVRFHMDYVGCKYFNKLISFFVVFVSYGLCGM